MVRAGPSCPGSSTRMCTCGASTCRPMWRAASSLCERGTRGHQATATGDRVGQLTGPTIYSLSPGLDASPGSWPFTQFVDDASEADSVVAAQEAAGGPRSRCTSASPAAFDSIVASVQRRHLRFAGHVPTAVTIQHALTTGMESIEHYTGYDRAVSRSGKGHLRLGRRRTGDVPALVDATVCPAPGTVPPWPSTRSSRASWDPRREPRRGESPTVHEGAATGRGATGRGTDAGINITAAGTSMLDERGSSSRPDSATGKPCDSRRSSRTRWRSAARHRHGGRRRAPLLNDNPLTNLEAWSIRRGAAARRVDRGPGASSVMCSTRFFLKSGLHGRRQEFRLQRFVDRGSCNSDGTSMDVKLAPTITSSMVVFPVISVTSTIPVSGARTTPAKKAAMPASAKPSG